MNGWIGYHDQVATRHLHCVAWLPESPPYQFKLFQIHRRGVVGLNQGPAMIENGTDDQPQGEHVAQDAAGGLQLDLRGCRGRRNN